jgi:hypothetical protein
MKQDSDESTWYQNSDVQAHDNFTVCDVLPLLKLVFTYNINPHSILAMQNALTAILFWTCSILAMPNDQD